MPDVYIEPATLTEGGILIYVIGERGASVKAATKTEAPCSLAKVIPPDWNASLSPWPAPKCFKGGDDFAGGADAFIDSMVDEIHEFEARAGIAPLKRGICGYSLGGLCALYSLYRTDLFHGAASVSGSMWFDGWVDFMENNVSDLAGRCVYLSVGDQEKRARNRRLAAVEECTRRAEEILTSRGVRTRFEMNAGNHFKDPDARLARGIDGLHSLLSGI